MSLGNYRERQNQFYLGVSLLLADEAVSRQTELGNTCVPNVFDQCADLICFRNIVRCTMESHEQMPHAEMMRDCKLFECQDHKVKES